MPTIKDPIDPNPDNNKKDYMCSSEIVNLYHKCLPELQPVRLSKDGKILNQTLIKQLQARLSDNQEFQSIDFYKTAHQKIYDACLQLFRKKEPVNLLSVVEKLKTLGVLEEVGGASYIAQITDCPVAGSVSHYISVIKGKAILRQTIVTANQIMQDCYDATEDPVEILNNAQKSILEINQIGFGKDPFISMLELTFQSTDRYDALNQGKTPNGLYTGFKKLDGITGGLYGSKLIILAARPRIGKTALMLCISRGVEIIFIDQFSKIQTDRNKSRFEQKSEIVERLGDLKKELRIPIVLLAQINRNIEGRNIKKPTLGDLKDTGQLEEEADMVLLLHREEEYLDMSDANNHEFRGAAELEIAKNRSGPCIDIELKFYAKKTHFMDAG